jgi:hypothetical protein
VFATAVDVRIRKLPVSTRLVLVGTGPVSGYLVSAPVQSGLLRRRRGLSYLSRSNWRRLFDVTEICIIRESMTRPEKKEIQMTAMETVSLRNISDAMIQSHGNLRLTRNSRERQRLGWAKVYIMGNSIISARG